MSGIVGLVNLDGEVVDQQLLWRLTSFLSSRGPDAQNIWTRGNVGLGHTLLITTWEAEHESQPLTLDGKVWLTADVRIDARNILIEELESKLGRRISSKELNDAELVLLSYEAWGTNCVNHLIGDFAFGLWDSQKALLFCARDHLGVKPFYWFRQGSIVAFSNTLNCLRRHPSITSALNDQAIADFLLFGLNYNSKTTAFSDIARLPPAHTLEVSDESIVVRNYWTVPVEPELKLRSPNEYVETFGGLFKSAVEDRTRVDRVAVSMSGGLDSSAVAAIATARASGLKNRKPRAFTMVYDHLLPDRERHYSGLVADALQIPISYREVDNYCFFDRIEDSRLIQPEPSDFPLLALYFDFLSDAAAEHRVLLSGEGGDPLTLYTWRDLVRTVNRVQFWRLTKYLLYYVLTYQTLPRLGYRESLRSLTGSHHEQNYVVPSWLNENLSKRLDLQERVNEINSLNKNIHPNRPEAYANFLSPVWADAFERNDAGVTGLPLEIRYPLFDIRLVKFMLSIPAIPWCTHKEIIRKAVKGLLPETIRRRPKTSLAGDQFSAVLGQTDARIFADVKAAPELHRYVQDEVALHQANDLSRDQLQSRLRVFSLNYWLAALEQA